MSLLSRIQAAREDGREVSYRGTDGISRIQARYRGQVVAEALGAIRQDEVLATIWEGAMATIERNERLERLGGYM